MQPAGISKCPTPPCCEQFDMLETSSTRNRMAYLIGGLVLFGLGIIVALQLKQTDLQSPNWFPKCVFHKMTGLHCVGCGATRAVQSILQGDLISALRYNPAFVVGGPLIGFLIWRRRTKERLGQTVTPNFCWYVFAFIVLYSAARNIPSPTTSWFAPPAGENTATSVESPVENA